MLFVYVFVVVARQCAPVCFSEKHIRYNAVNVLANKYKGCWRVQKLPASDMRAMPCCLVTRFSLRLGTLRRLRRSRRSRRSRLMLLNLALLVSPKPVTVAALCRFVLATERTPLQYPPAPLSPLVSIKHSLHFNFLVQQAAVGAVLRRRR